MLMNTNDETKDDDGETITDKIDAYMVNEQTKRQLEKIFDKVLQNKVSGIHTTITQLTSKYMGASDINQKIDILTGLVVLCLAGITYDKSISSRAIKISQSSK
jgi:hypothetical protein